MYTQFEVSVETAALEKLQESIPRPALESSSDLNLVYNLISVDKVSSAVNWSPIHEAELKTWF
jgi:hypothetical protein